MNDSLLGLGLHVLRLGVWLALLVALFVPLERVFALRPSAVLRRGIWQDVGFYFVSSLLPGLVVGVPLALLATGARAALPAPMTQWLGDLPVWGRVAIGLVLAEIGAYWGHRWSHEIPLLWRFHALHHEAEHMDFLVNTRAHPVDMVFTRLCALAPLYALGLAGPAQPQGGTVAALVLVIGAAWGFFIHANVRWRFGLLEHLIASPAFHHWHHTSQGRLDINYAPLLPWIDRLFGTLHLPRESWPETYGIAPTEPSEAATPSPRPAVEGAAHRPV